MKGIDVSEFQGSIDWKLVAKEIDFAIIRAGYGNNHLDKCFKNNIKGCKNNNIPFGVYWFSYALKPSDAIQEAKCILKLIENEPIEYPICFDYESASIDYAKKKGFAPSVYTVESIAASFLNEIKNAKKPCALYTNLSYINLYYKNLIAKYDVWLAQWNVPTPYKPNGLMPCIWQYTSKGKVNGINGNVDMNYCYKNYIQPKQEINDEKINLTTKNILFNNVDRYSLCVKNVLAGKYGNGSIRKEKLMSDGYDPKIIQEIINNLL